MTTTTTHRSTGETSATADGNVLDERQGFPGRGRWLTLGLLVSAQFLVMLDTAIVNVALPSIQADLGLGAADATWAVNAYVVTSAACCCCPDAWQTCSADAACSPRARPCHRRHAAGSRGPGPRAVIGGPRRPGRRRSRAQPAAMSLLMLAFPGRARARAMSSGAPPRRSVEPQASRSADCSPAPWDGGRCSS